MTYLKTSSLGVKQQTLTVFTTFSCDFRIALQSVNQTAATGGTGNDIFSRTPCVHFAEF
jgi:hypothetical protein